MAREAPKKAADAAAQAEKNRKERDEAMASVAKKRQEAEQRAKDEAQRAATQRHYELMARYVHPHFQRSREWRRESYAYAKSHHAEFTGQSSAAVQAEIDRQKARQARAAE